MLNQSISLKRVAVHEAAHAVAAVALELGVRSASVYPDRMKRREKPFGYVARTGDSDDANPRATIIFQFAGAAGERLLMGDNPQGGVTDSEVADELLNRHFQQLRWPSETRGELRHRLQQEAESLVASHRDDIEQIAEALLDRHSLSGLEIERFMKRKKDMSIECEHGSCERIAYMVKTDASGNVLHKTPEEDSGTNPMHRNVAAEIHELAMKRMQGTGAKDYVAAINDVLRKHSQLRAAYEHYVSGRPATTEAYKTKPRAGEQYGNLSDIITLKTKEYMARIGETDFRKAARFVIQNDPELGRRYVAQCCVTNVQMEHGE